MMDGTVPSWRQSLFHGTVPQNLWWACMTIPTGRDSDKFVLRLPDGMRDRLKAEAEKNKRSLNAEIVARLEASLAPAPPMGSLLGLGKDDAVVLTREEFERLQTLTKLVTDMFDELDLGKSD